MNSDFYAKNRLLIVVGAALVVLAHLLFEYFHGGIVTHYIMQDDSLPGISNWWGLISFPLATWIVLLWIEKRKSSSPQKINRGSSTLYRLAGGIIFGIVVSYLFSIESSVLDYLMLGLFGLSLFIPLYYGEYLIGFTIGTMYVFGANIPIIGGCVLLLILLIIYKLPRVVLNFIRSKV